MGPVAIVTIASSILLVYFFFRKKVPKFYDVGAVDTLAMCKKSISPILLKICFATLIAIDVGYIIASLSRIPVSVVICSGAIFLAIVYWSMTKAYPVGNKFKGLTQLAKEINWDIILFMLCIFLVVQGLESAALVEFLASTFNNVTDLTTMLSIFIPSIVVTIGASFMNNWPMTILGLLSIEQVVAAGINETAVTGLIFSNVIGNNLGPHFFPLGSLAILMWIDCMRRRGIQISIKEYLKVGAVLSIIEVAVASLVLWIELSLGFTLGL
jgi:arsenical pump membrane protein